MNWEIRPLTETFGAEIRGIDLARDTGEDALAEVKRLWAEHQLLLFRDQALSEENLVTFSKGLGRLEIHVREEFLSPEHPEVLMISNIKRDGKPIGILSDTEVGWHYDQIYLPRPATGSLLYSVQLPEEGGATSFADMIAAYEALPQDVKDKLEGKRAVQSYEAFNAQYSVPTNDKQKKRTQDIDHPIVRTHPISGRKALYLCPGMTTQILGMDKAESDDMLAFLFEWTVRPQFVYSHEWTLGDALLWDNASTMHRREPFNQDEERLMKRTTILPPEEIAVPV